MYWRDPREYLRVGTSLPEMRGLVDACAAIPSLAAGDDTGGLSVCLVAGFGADTIGFEAVIGAGAIDSLYERLFAVLAGNRGGLCALAGTVPWTKVPKIGPPEVTSRVAVTFDVPSYDPATQTHAATMRVRNVSLSPLTGPIVVPLLLDSSVSLVGAEGWTCMVRPAGAPYVTLAPGGLASGAQLSRTLFFKVSDRTPVRPRVREVYAGDGVL
jgi:hypothetical protein